MGLGAVGCCYIVFETSPTGFFEFDKDLFLVVDRNGDGGGGIYTYYHCHKFEGVGWSLASRSPAAQQLSINNSATARTQLFAAGNKLDIVNTSLCESSLNPDTLVYL